MEPRLSHVLALARKAETLPLDDSSVLVVSAVYLHYIGYSPTLADIGLHQIGGAPWLASRTYVRKRTGANKADLDTLRYLKRYIGLSAPTRGTRLSRRRSTDRRLTAIGASVLSAVSMAYPRCAATCTEVWRTSRYQKVARLCSRHSDSCPIDAV